MKNWKVAADMSSPEKFFPLLDQSKEDFLTARVSLRRVHENLLTIYRDASGVYWRDNYLDPNIKKIGDALYKMDLAMGDGIRALDSLAIMKKKLP